jgi:hypothetical protein
VASTMASGSSTGTGSSLFRKAFIVCFNPRPRKWGDKENPCTEYPEMSICFTQ